MIEQQVRVYADPVNKVLNQLLPWLVLLVICVIIITLLRKIKFSLKSRKFKLYDSESTNNWFVWGSYEENKEEKNKSKDSRNRS